MDSRRIAFITSAHSAYDDRIYYHLADTLSQYYEVLIISSEVDAPCKDGRILVQTFDGSKISKRDKVNAFVKAINDFSPNIIISSEPFPVIAAHAYKKRLNSNVKILYDITEWYPSPRNLESVYGLGVVPRIVGMLLLNWYASFLCDGFIFGEYYKSLPYRILFPFKKWRIISYYVDFKYVSYREKVTINSSLCLCYSGRISVEKGIVNFINVSKSIKSLQPNLKLKLKIIGWFHNEKDEEIYNRTIAQLSDVEIEFIDRQNFLDLSEKIQEVDICFDLRELNFNNQYSLPIKLFFYAACGRPVIYSDIKAIRKGLPEINQFGYLVSPSDSMHIAEIVLQYIDNPMLYKQHALSARKLMMDQYNWQLIASDIMHFVSSFN